MLAVRDNNPAALKSFHSDTDASTLQFFNAYAAELPPSMDARFRAYGTKFLEKHARATLGALFKLSRMQCRGVLRNTGGYVRPGRNL